LSSERENPLLDCKAIGSSQNLALQASPLDVNVRRLVAIIGVKEKAIRTGSKNRRHRATA